MHAPHPGHWHLLFLPPALGLQSRVHPSWLGPEQSFPPVGGTEITVFPVISTRCKRFNIGWHTKWFLSTAYKDDQCLMFNVHYSLLSKTKWYSLERAKYGVVLCGKMTRMTDIRWHKNALYTYTSFQIQLGPTVSQERHNVTVTLLSCET